MSSTPFHLRQLGVPENAGPAKAVPRAIHAYRRERGNKKEVLSLYYSMVLAGSLPEYGASQNWTRGDITQEIIAGMNGVRRETITHRLGRCSAGRKTWEPGRRERRSKQARERAAARGLRIHNRPLRALEAAKGVIFTITPRFGRTNLVDGPGGASGGKKTRVAELLATRYGDQLFDPQARANGFKEIPAWLWHKALPDPVECECQLGQAQLAFQTVCSKCDGQGWHFREPSKLERDRGLQHGSLPDYARLLASWYLMLGIEEEIPELRTPGGDVKRKRSPAGMLQIRQSDKAAALGMDEDTVRKMDWKLEKLLIVKIVPGEKEYYAGTRKVKSSEPDKTLWMPTRLLDREICVAERERFMRAKEKVNEVQGAHPDRLHLELLREWEGKPHSLGAFWNELRRRYAHHGVPKDIRDALLPVYRE